MRILLVSEVYPPRCGGAGWSTRALAVALRDAGHEVSVATTSSGPKDLDGLAIQRLEVTGARRRTIPRAFAAVVGKHEADVVHAQHSLSALGCLAGPKPGRVAVTVRDHWPVCFWSTRISRGRLCPRCSPGAMTQCTAGHVPAPAPFSWGAIPYMETDLWLKRRALRRAGATLAVSRAIADELNAEGIPRVEVLPNIVDPREAHSLAAEPPSFEVPAQYLLFVGKLEENKGAHDLVPAVAAANTGLPLVVLGSGSLGPTIKARAAALGVPLIMRGWADRRDVIRTMSRATALVFPSLWPEPLSRVLLEALVVGTPIVAIDTGGTPDIIEDGESGLLVKDVAGLTAALGRMASDDVLRDRLMAGARRRAYTFYPETLVPRYVGVYQRLLQKQQRMG